LLQLLCDLPDAQPLRPSLGQNVTGCAPQVHAAPPPAGGPPRDSLAAAQEVRGTKAGSERQGATHRRPNHRHQRQQLPKVRHRRRHRRRLCNSACTLLRCQGWSRSSGQAVLQRHQEHLHQLREHHDRLLQLRRVLGGLEVARVGAGRPGGTPLPTAAPPCTRAPWLPPALLSQAPRLEHGGQERVGRR
jgi:hypothetical protein